MDNALAEILIESIRNDVALVGPHLKAISERVISEQISDFPVFVAAQSIVDVGKPIFDRDSVQLNWFFNASILEEFIRREIVKPDRVAAFKRAFGDPLETACIFVVTPENAQFVFVPFAQEGAVKPESE